ncbi:hypothetical protein A2U01_0118056, partial [Trifolium medium]|nr:hypothetical protein [Trifolium medium]
MCCVEYALKSQSQEVRNPGCMLVWALGAGSWVRGALMSRNTACCARRRLMGAGRTY